VAGIRDTLIGISTQSSIDSVVAHSLARVQSAGNQQQSFLTKNISTILWTLGAILAALLILAAVLFVRKRKSDNMLRVVTKQINTIPDKQSYDDLTKKISASSKQEGVEQDLRVFLAKNIPPVSK
jgi:beta-lactamase regulating signal transducer with metallopeptidase domain